MGLERIKDILEEHGLPCWISMNKVYVQEWSIKDRTEWKTFGPKTQLPELLEWLGY